MNKKTNRYTNVLNEVNEMLCKVKSLNEAISFDEEYDIERDNEFDDEVPMTPEVEMTPEKEECVGPECDEVNDIDTIREIALKGMLKYVKQSNSSEYETLKKIFQFCDKVNNDKTSEPVEEK